jgi:beta-galactosidase GanA
MSTFKIVSVIVLLASISITANSQPGMPALQRNGTTTQLYSNGKPFLILGGELGNSSASDIKYLQPIWGKLKKMHCNTVLLPVYWELMEPTQGKFDFSLIDSAIDSARAHDLKLVLLWFGSWKNSMSCYVPDWVKKDWKKYPRSYDRNGIPQEILTAFSVNNLNADISAFSNLIAHVKERDGNNGTVLMIQVENEIGMLPEARDYHSEATVAFNRQVPALLINYLVKNKTTLSPALSAAWNVLGNKTKGTWEEVFGKSLATDELFTAWYYADFANRIATEGKKIYSLPMFANAALNRPGSKPGEYPSGGPLPHLVDIWKAAAPAIDFLSPDFYNPNFKSWNDLYKREDNPLFIPEIRFEPSVAPKTFYAFGHYKALGFSPFSIESTDKPESEPLGKAYNILNQLAHLISKSAAQMDGVLIDKNTTTEVTLGDYLFSFKHDFTLGWSPGAKEDVWPQAGALIIQLATDEFIIAGTGVVVTFAKVNNKGRAGILAIDEGHFEEEKFIAGRRLNGDQSHQGRHLRIPNDQFDIQKLTLYSYE